MARLATWLPLEQRLTLPDGTSLLAVHAYPGRDDGPGLEPETSGEEFGILLRGCNADLVCVGHTHRPWERRLVDVHVVNVGSVSNPPRNAVDRRASYAVLEATVDAYRIHLHRIAYDTDAVIQAIREHHVFPNPE